MSAHSEKPRVIRSLESSGVKVQLFPKKWGKNLIHPAERIRKENIGARPETVLRKMNAAEARGEYDEHESNLALAEVRKNLADAEKEKIERSIRNGALINRRFAPGMLEDQRQEQLDIEYEQANELHCVQERCQGLGIPVREKAKSPPKNPSRHARNVAKAQLAGRDEPWMYPDRNLKGCDRLCIMAFTRGDDFHITTAHISKVSRRKFLGIATIGPCGKCELCIASKGARAAGAFEMEAMTGAAMLFWTLTFRRDDGDPSCSDAINMFRLARMRLNKKLKRTGRSFRAICAMEPHKDGVAHFHMITFGIRAEEFQDLRFLELNKYGSRVFHAQEGVRAFWPHGIVRVIENPDPRSPDGVKFMSYCSGYAAKGVLVTEDVERGMHDRGDDYDWSKQQLIWPRPAIGTLGAETLVKEKGEDLEMGGLTAVPYPVGRRTLLAIENQMREAGRYFIPNAFSSTIDHAKEAIADAQHVIEMNTQTLWREYNVR